MRDESAYSIDGIEKNDRYVIFLSEFKEQKVLFYLQEWGGLVRVWEWRNEGESDKVNDFVRCES